MAKINEKITWVNKICGHEEVDPAQLLAHPLNWRVHSSYQQEALRGVIGDIGYIKSVTVSKRSGLVLDGHLRIIIALRDSVPLIPVEYVDLTEAEEAEALLTIDPIAALAGSDKDNLTALLSKVSTEDDAVLKLLTETAEDAGVSSKIIDYSDLDEQLESMSGMEDESIIISIPAKHKELVLEYLANGESLTSAGLGRGVMKRCELL